MSMLPTDLKNSIHNYLNKQGDINLLADVYRAISRCVYTEYHERFLFVYGSLRQGEYNYHRIRDMFGEKSLVPLAYTYISSAKIYDLGDYPVVLTSDYANKVYGNIMYVDELAATAIRDMELGAGFKIDKTLSWLPDGPSANRAMFIDIYKGDSYLSNIVKNGEISAPLVESGNWSKYIRQAEEEIID